MNPVGNAGEACVSCGRPAGTPYCPHCGERRAADRHYSLAHFGEEAFETFTHADNTLARTFAALLRRPGELTRAYMAGIRMPYMKPLPLFLIINLVYFLWAAAMGEHVFDTPLRQHLLNAYGAHAQQLVQAREAERHLSKEAYEAAFNAAATVQAKSLVIVMVPMFALVLAAVQWRRRRPFVHHLVFALHLYCMLLLLTMAQRYVVQWPLALVARLGWRPSPGMADVIVTTVLLSAVGIYLGMALRRAYGETRVAAAIKAVPLAAAILAVLLVYRALLFYTTYWAA